MYKRVFKPQRLKSQIRIISFPEGVYFACGKSGVYYFNWFIIIFFIVFMFNGLATWAFIPASIAC